MTEPLVEMKLDELAALSTMRRLAGKSGLKLKPFYGWTFWLLSSFVALALTFCVAVVLDFASWYFYLVFLLLGVALFIESLTIVGVNRQLDKLMWIHAGNLGRFSLTKTHPLGHHESLIDMQAYLEERGTYVEAGTCMMKVVRDLWQPCGYAVGVGADGGKDYGHLATMRAVYLSDDGGKTWTMVYKHPLILMGDTYVFFQYFVPTKAARTPAGMLTELCHAYEEDVTTGEIAIAEGFYHMGTLGRARVGEKVDVREALDDIFFPTGVLPPVPVLAECCDLRGENFRLRDRNDELQSELARRSDYERETNG